MSDNVEEEITRWSKEVKRGAVSLAVMALLSGGRAYGYELVKQLDEKASFLSLEQGTVYPILRRLEKRRLLAAEWDYTDPAKPKKYYTLTREGEKAVRMMSKIWRELSDGMDRIVKEVSGE